jgi:hypothetical protein
MSGPHDRYDSRLVWIATLAVLIAGFLRFTHDDQPGNDSLPL